MLEPWIIEQIRRREEEERRRRDERPVLELPVADMPPWPKRNESDEREEQDDDEPKRGVVIIGM